MPLLRERSLDLRPLLVAQVKPPLVFPFGKLDAA